MKIKRCYLCSEQEFAQVDGKVKNIPELKIFRCRNCGLVFLESFDHIDENLLSEILDA